MVSVRIAVALALGLLPAPSMAAAIRYEFQADLVLAQGVDVRGLAGSRMTWTVDADDSVPPYEVRGYGVGGSAYLYAPLAVGFAVTQRPGGLPNLLATGTFPEIQVGDALEVNCCGNLDGIEVGQVVLAGPLDGLELGRFTRYFTADYYQRVSGSFPFPSTYVPLPTDVSSAATITVPLSLVSESSAPASLRYDLVNVTATAYLVPIPAAAWLFGGAIVVLARLRRRSE